LEKLVATPDTSDPDFPRIANYYKSCMDEDRIEKEGEAWLQARLKPVDALKTKADALAAIGSLHESGVSLFFGFGSTPGGLNRHIENAGVSQGGLSLPNRDYYTRDDDKSKEIRAKFVDHVGRMFVLAGETDLAAKADAQAVMDIENKLALTS